MSDTFLYNRIEELENQLEASRQECERLRELFRFAEDQLYQIANTQVNFTNPVKWGDLARKAECACIELNKLKEQGGE